MEARLFRFPLLPTQFKPVSATWHRHLGAVAFFSKAKGIAIKLPCLVPVLNQQTDVVDVVGDATGGHELSLGGGHLAAGQVLNNLNGESERVEELKTQIALFVLRHISRHRHAK